MMTTINDDARMSELYKMRSEGVELERLSCGTNGEGIWVSARDGIIEPKFKYRAKAKPVYVWADDSSGEIDTDCLFSEPVNKFFKRYQLIETPEDE